MAASQGGGGLFAYALARMSRCAYVSRCKSSFLTPVPLVAVPWFPFGEQRQKPRRLVIGLLPPPTRVAAVRRRADRRALTRPCGLRVREDHRGTDCPATASCRAHRRSIA